MNIAKNMEAIFLAALAIICASSVATAAVPAHRAPAHVQASVDNVTHVVNVSAKRLSAADKAAF